jgi:hypothetical protein
MTSRIESSRSHGPFDPRRLVTRPAMPRWALHDARAGLDGDSFSSLNFSGTADTTRKAISAYVSYRVPKPSRPGGGAL